MLGRMWRRISHESDAPSPLAASDELSFLQREDFGPDDPRIEHPPGEPEDDDHLVQPGAEDGDDRDDQQNEGQGQPEIGETHQHLVHQAAVEPGDDAGEDTDHARDQHRGDTDSERDLRAEHEPTEQVTTELVRPEHVGRVPSAQTGGNKR